MCARMHSKRSTAAQYVFLIEYVARLPPPILFPRLEVLDFAFFLGRNVSIEDLNAWGGHYVPCNRSRIVP